MPFSLDKQMPWWLVRQSQTLVRNYSLFLILTTIPLLLYIHVATLKFQATNSLKEKPSGLKTEPLLKASWKIIKKNTVTPSKHLIPVILWITALMLVLLTLPWTTNLLFNTLSNKVKITPLTWTAKKSVALPLPLKKVANTNTLSMNLTKVLLLWRKTVLMMLLWKNG